MNSICIKHQSLPIDDLLIEYELNGPEKILNIHLENHLDPALLIEFFLLLEREKGIEIFDRKSQAKLGLDINPERYQVILDFVGINFDVRCVQMFKKKDEDKPQFTFQMEECEPDSSFRRMPLKNQ